MGELTRAQLRQLRSQAIDQLSDGFAADQLDLDEFEDRIDQAHRATDRQALEALLEGLGPTEALAVTGSSTPEECGGDAVPATASSTSLAVSTAEPQDRQSSLAIFGGVERTGSWRVPRRLRAVAICGGVELDLREAVFTPGVHEIKVTAVMGGVEIIVPPTVAVECNGSGILGGFESVNRAPRDPDPDRPLVRITGTAVLGGVEVTTRLPGESERQARNRRRDELARKKDRQLRE